MNSQIIHPSTKDLEAFLAYGLDRQAEESIDLHLADCDSCCAQMDAICAGDDGFAVRVAEIASQSTIDIRVDRTRVDDSNGHGDADSQKRTRMKDAIDKGLVSSHQRAQRYRFDHELGRGGMGIVYAGYDAVLDRELVLKVLSPRDHDDPDAIRRFLAEARICGNLQHPGIVPIHDLGHLDDDRPFFSMRRIEGQTLGDWLAARESPNSDQSRFLGIFLQVCQTVAYAHSRHIIHRDLKPRNIMIGAFGEVQVVDWGLALEKDEGRRTKETGNDEGREKADESHLHPASFLPPLCVLGTPAYMPPEQAMGRNDEVDKRADVFALGAILCEILTGHPPYVDTKSDKDVLLQQAREAKLEAAFERLDLHCDDHELVQFCKQCLSPRPDQRPADASCLAAALLDHRESIDQRLRQVEIERAQHLARAIEQRKRRKIVLLATFAILVLGGLLLSGTAYHRWQTAKRDHALTTAAQQRRRLELALTTEQDDFARAMTLAGFYQGQELKNLLQLFREAASETLPEDATQSLFSQYPSTESNEVTEHEFVRRLLEAHVWKVTYADPTMRKHCLGEADRAYRAAFAVFAGWNAPGAISDEEAVLAIDAYGPATRRAVIDALDDWSQVAQSRDVQQENDPPSIYADWFVKLANRLDDDPNRSKLRHMMAARDADGMVRLRKDISLQKTSPALIHLLAVALADVDRMSDAENLLREARKVYPHHFWLSGRVLATEMRDESASKAAAWSPRSQSDPTAVFLSARANVRLKRYDTALTQYQWIFRDFDLLEQHLNNAQMTYFVRAWSEFGDVYPKAHDELTQLRDRCEQLVLHDEQFLVPFRILVAIDSQLYADDWTAALFMQLDREQPKRAREVFSLAEASLITQDKHAIIAKYAKDNRSFPKIVGADPSILNGEQKRQFETLVTLIALYTRDGRSREAIEIASDAKMLWSNDEAHTAIDRALEGILPTE